LTPDPLRARLEAIHRAALRACDAEAAVARVLRRDDRGVVLDGLRLKPDARIGALAVGKAAAGMARACEQGLGDALAFALAITKDRHGLPLRHFRLREAAHPVPDARGAAAAREALALACAEPAPDALLVLLSGGASALWSCPLPGLDADDLAATTRALLRGGASIDELNTVRKHLCELTGGRLARAAASPRVVGLLISDVPGDRLEVIASGPLTPDPSRFADALAVLETRCSAGSVPPAVLAHLRAGVDGRCPESPKPGERGFERVQQRILVANATALAASAEAGRAAGYRVRVLDGGLRGEARDAGMRLAREALALRSPTPLLLVIGGETAVTVRGDGRGGRSQELALAAALALDGTRGIALLAAGTDGTDGPTDAAGAHADGGSVARGRALGLDAAAALDRNDSYGFFHGEGGLLRTGPTGTNVMDLALVAVHPEGTTGGTE
jgi:glycerate-2-kinase